jgi:eukaryotic-like serine/threonine-protein kinase
MGTDRGGSGSIADAPAERIGRYHLRERLGQGGFACVYRAHDPVLGRDVALKVLLPHVAEDADARRRFAEEARLLSSLHHPNIVVVYDIDEAAGQPYMAMELIRGETLSALSAERGPLPLEGVERIVRGLCAAVAHLHERGLIHRDITPANVIVAGDGRVVLTDFGIARALEAVGHTRGSHLLGTPSALAPEQVLGRPATPASDVYAVGVVMYQLLAGRPPFTGDTSRVIHGHAFELPPALRSLRPGLPEAVYGAVDAALDKDPDRRPVVADLAASLVDHGPRRPPSRIRPRGTRAAVARPAREHDAGAAAGDGHHPVKIRPRMSRGRRGGWERPALLGGVAAALAVALLSLLWARDVPPDRAAVSNVAVVDNVFDAREGAFVVADSVAVCFTMQPGRRGTPVTAVLSPTAVSEGGAGSSVIAQSAPIGAAATAGCHPIPVGSAGLAPGEYRVAIVQDGAPLAAAQFRALPSDSEPRR